MLRILIAFLAVTVASLGSAEAQQAVKASTTAPMVGTDVALRLEPAPDRNQSVLWELVKGSGKFSPSVTQANVTFTPDQPGEIVILCVVTNSRKEEFINRVVLRVTGAATAPAPTPASAPPPRPAPPSTQKPPAAPAPGAPPPPVGDLPLASMDTMHNVVGAGYMGDAMPENGGTATLDEGHTMGCRGRNLSCSRIDFKPNGKVGWAAFAWQVVRSGSMNWGQDPGTDLTAGHYQSLRIWARTDTSATGGTLARVQFKSGGNVALEHTKTNAPSHTVAGPTTEIPGTWVERCLDLRDKRLNNVISPLTVVVTKVANPRGAVILIDDVVFSKAACSSQ